MSKTKFQGFFPALLSLYDEKGAIDEKALKALVEYQIVKLEIDGFYVTGSTGEFLLLTFEERKKIMEIVALSNQKRKTLIAQIGAPNFQETLQLAKVAEALHYDAISALSPLYYQYRFEAIYNYYQKLSQASQLPLIIYYIPQLAGSKLSFQELSKLLEIPKVIGFKYAAQDLITFERLQRHFPDKVFFYSVDELLGAALNYGAQSFIGSTYNWAAPQAKKIVAAHSNGEFLKVQTLSQQYNDYIFMLLETELMPTLKALLSDNGLKLQSQVRFPLLNPDPARLEAQVQKIKEIWGK